MTPQVIQLFTELAQYPEGTDSMAFAEYGHETISELIDRFALEDWICISNVWKEQNIAIQRLLASLISIYPDEQSAKILEVVTEIILEMIHTKDERVSYSAQSNIAFSAHSLLITHKLAHIFTSKDIAVFKNTITKNPGDHERGFFQYFIDLYYKTTYSFPELKTYQYQQSGEYFTTYNDTDILFSDSGRVMLPNDGCFIFGFTNRWTSTSIYWADVQSIYLTTNKNSYYDEPYSWGIEINHQFIPLQATGVSDLTDILAERYGIPKEQFDSLPDNPKRDQLIKLWRKKPKVNTWIMRSLYYAYIEKKDLKQWRKDASKGFYRVNNYGWGGGFPIPEDTDLISWFSTKQELYDSLCVTKQTYTKPIITEKMIQLGTIILPHLYTPYDTPHDRTDIPTTYLQTQCALGLDRTENFEALEQALTDLLGKPDSKEVQEHELCARWYAEDMMFTISYGLDSGTHHCRETEIVDFTVVNNQDMSTYYNYKPLITLSAYVTIHTDKVHIPADYRQSVFAFRKDEAFSEISEDYSYLIWKDDATNSLGFEANNPLYENPHRTHNSCVIIPIDQVSQISITPWGSWDKEFSVLAVETIDKEIITVGIHRGDKKIFEKYLDQIEEVSGMRPVVLPEQYEHH